MWIKRQLAQQLEYRLLFMKLSLIKLWVTGMHHLTYKHPIVQPFHTAETGGCLQLWWRRVGGCVCSSANKHAFTCLTPDLWSATALNLEGSGLLLLLQVLPVSSHRGHLANRGGSTDCTSVGGGTSAVCAHCQLCADSRWKWCVSRNSNTRSSFTMLSESSRETSGNEPLLKLCIALF